MIRHPKKRKLRIVGGKWRGRKISFPDLPTLRPTSNRIRETLFNWLHPYLKHSYCLDLFAGSGALGFESLSRGCTYSIFIDCSKSVIANLKKNASVLNATNVKFFQKTFPYNIFQGIKNTPFNIVFLDPPFYQDLINQAFFWLEKMDILAPESYIYVESEKDALLKPPKNWESYREKKTTKLFYGLFFRS
ncbi:16S rRNA (guanine(966)-N(2))-methyltransferase RsmD [Coxiella endosymbiont of Amblyomma sculptum]|uniref:16S rRNA (guanine(966)-N(2))-methyltransferase RsmD n=1 Tax=Coxiella endosymbiont of Amblyomma sculptum TaxID=2487929 RepID=UPI00132ED62A|nr:16S rRNA (guanine(966)-N(2))-methyltransferase RsmD [Coxiella endosymbiont of Amblyomma sculptum]QHG92198.1 16S rRNA (guanine(966)-N(2))-methyltransferase RsmD [Coxiella endosymbiont of Amblyomma sculptum]